MSQSIEDNILRPQLRWSRRQTWMVPVGTTFRASYMVLLVLALPAERRSLGCQYYYVGERSVLSASAGMSQSVPKRAVSTMKV